MDFSSIAFVGRARTFSSGSGFSPTYLGRSFLDSGFGDRTHTAPVTLSAGQKYVISVSFLNTGASVHTGLLVNGTAAVSLISSSTDEGSTVYFYDVTPTTSGTTVIVQVTSGPSRNILHYWSIPNAATYQTGVGTPSTNPTNSGLTRTLSVNVPSGAFVLATTSHDGFGGAGTLATGVTWSGLTAEAGSFFASANDISSGAARAENVLAESPRIITVDRIGTANSNAGFAAAAAVFA
jgi:hypothetical protein